VPGDPQDHPLCETLLDPQIAIGIYREMIYLYFYDNGRFTEHDDQTAGIHDRRSTFQSIEIESSPSKSDERLRKASVNSVQLVSGRRRAIPAQHKTQHKITRRTWD
jgi:hypothetical protein